MTQSIKGHCLCGAVTVSVQQVDTKVGACHCSMCRRWGGGPLLAVDCHTEVEFSGEQHVKSFASSEWAERGFCGQCGTHLFYKLLQTGQFIMPVGLFNNIANLEFDHQIFIDEKPTYYEFANQTKNMTGEEVFAQYS
ncbi:GFA family protein [Pleionea litopenaei]|uniref:GFA family protein n=1 Tax=Pleionea litopenaei TaxID=3070815 RepID=A0AA51RQC9_9GAMM|nr:GFA family protein [Pleionea sp. HL-JVS1]WMS85671.1 GFA family protein [Pleionea sp. HL-JVS1]